MTANRIMLSAVLLVATGCASGPRGSLSGSRPGENLVDAPQIVLASLQAKDEQAVPALPSGVRSASATTEEAVTPEPLMSSRGLALGMLEEMALASNPAIAQSSARVAALRGKWVQAGLPPNPTAGYTAGEIGNDGRGGQQGGFVGQTFITANKLRRDQAIVAAEITQAEQQLAATQRRVLTDVRHAYYRALLAQRRVELAEELLGVTTEAAEMSKSLLEAQEIPLAGLLQTEIGQQNAQVLLRTAKNAQDQAWRRLSAVVGGPEFPKQELEGDVTTLPDDLNWGDQLVRLQTESPEIAAALAEVDRARRALNRECVEAVPDIDTQVSVQYDDATDDTIAGVQVGMPLPLWNRNEGGIRRARAEITEATRNLQRVEQNLSQRLADAFRSYSDAQVTATSIAADILPRSRRALELERKGYEQGEVGYLDLLAAQQTYSQTNLAYLDALDELWRSYVLIDGLLLEDGLGNTQL